MYARHTCLCVQQYYCFFCRPGHKRTHSVWYILSIVKALFAIIIVKCFIPGTFYHPASLNGEKKLELHNNQT